MLVTQNTTLLPPPQLNETSRASALHLSAAPPRPYESLTDQMLMKALLPHAKALDPYNNSAVTYHDLKRLSEEGIQPNGQRATSDLIALVHELLQRNELISDLDIASGAGYQNGTIKLDSIAKTAGDFSNASDHQLLLAAEKYHKEFDSTGNGYVNFNELKQAAGLVHSDRHFSDEAKSVASTLLNRPELLKKLDIGVGFLGFAGKEDQRYDLDNLKYLIRNASHEFNHPFKSRTD